MHIGVAMFATDYAIPIDELARETEARGLSRCGCPSIPISPPAGAPHGLAGVSCLWNIATPMIPSSP